MSKGEWRPKVGERVKVQDHSNYAAGKIGVVVRDDGTPPEYMMFHVEVAPSVQYWFSLSELVPLPELPAPTAREPWEVLREAAGILENVRTGLLMWGPSDIRREAAKLEAAAAPKVPTLAEAVRAWLDEWDRTGMADNSPMREALARAEAGQ